MIIFIIVPKPAGYKFNNTHTEKINIYVDDANNVITDSYKKCGEVEEKKSKKKKVMWIWFWQKTGIRALYLERRDIFKTQLHKYFGSFQKPSFFFFILSVADVPLMS